MLWDNKNSVTSSEESIRASYGFGFSYIIIMTFNIIAGVGVGVSLLGGLFGRKKRRRQRIALE